MITISQHHKDDFKKRNLKPTGKKINLIEKKERRHNIASFMFQQSQEQTGMPSTVVGIRQANWATVICGEIKVGRCNESYDDSAKKLTKRIINPRKKPTSTVRYNNPHMKKTNHRYTPM